MNGCRRCAIEVFHCHGTLVRHEDGGRECSAGECTGEPDLHDLVLTCDEAWSGCCTEGSAGACADGAASWRHGGKALAG